MGKKRARNWKRDPSRRSRTGRFDIEPYERMSIIWKIVISRLSGSPGPFVSRICIHTPTHAHARAHRPLLRGRERTMQFARAISGHSSPFSASHEWHGNRLSITHAHSRDRDTWRGTPSIRRRESKRRMRAMMRAHGKRNEEGEVQLERRSLRVLLLRAAPRSGGRGCEAAAATFAFSPSRKERFVLAWPTARTMWPTTRATFGIRRVSHVRQVIKWHNDAPESAHRAGGLRVFLAKPAVAIKCDGKREGDWSLSYQIEKFVKNLNAMNINRVL